MPQSDFPLKSYIPPGAQRVFQGARFDVYTLHRGDTQRDVIAHPGAVVILPIADDGRVVMIRNERFSVGEVLWELPAGTLEEGEEPAVTAARELKEETGYACAEVSPLLSFYTTPGFCNERMFGFLATGLEPGKQHLDEAEKISVSLIGLPELLSMIRSGDVCDAKTIAMLLFYAASGDAGRCP